VSFKSSDKQRRTEQYSIFPSRFLSAYARKRIITIHLAAAEMGGS